MSTRVHSSRGGKDTQRRLGFFFLSGALDVSGEGSRDSWAGSREGSGSCGPGRDSEGAEESDDPKAEPESQRSMSGVLRNESYWLLGCFTVTHASLRYGDSRKLHNLRYGDSRKFTLQTLRYWDSRKLRSRKKLPRKKFTEVYVTDFTLR